MSCIHCEHCRESDRDRQAAANLHPLGTHLVHPRHGRVVYWRNDISSDGRPGIGHYVYRAGDKDRDLFYIGDSDFTLATVEIDLPGSFASWMAADFSENSRNAYSWWKPAERQALAEALRDGRTIKRGRSASRRIAVTFEVLGELRNLAYFVRDTARAGKAAVAASRQVIKRANAELNA